MNLNNFFAVRGAAAPARDAQGGTLSTRIAKMKRDAEFAPAALPELTPEQREIQAHRNGLFVADHLFRGECPQELADLWATFRADFGPTGAIEEELMRHLTSAAWGLRRIDRIESRMWNRHASAAAPANHAQVSILLAAALPQIDPTLMDRYRKIFERRWDAALKQLLHYRKATGRKPAQLPKEMPFARLAERAPLPTLVAAPEPESSQPDRS